MSGHYDRSALRKPSPGRLYSEWKNSPTCPAGHDITAPGSKVNAQSKIYCRQCRQENAKRSESFAEDLRAGLPSTEILDEAACSPATARLFEPISRANSDYGTNETPGEGQARHDRAKAICARCPVREKCFSDALKYKRVGVYGGVSMSERYHRALREQLANQIVA